MRGSRDGTGVRPPLKITKYRTSKHYQAGSPRECDMENFYPMPMYLFSFFTIRSEHYETMWAGAYITNVISEGSGEPALLYNLVWISLPTKSFEGDKG